MDLQTRCVVVGAEDDGWCDDRLGLSFSCAFSSRIVLPPRTKELFVWRNYLGKYKIRKLFAGARGEQFVRAKDGFSFSIILV